VTDWLLHGSETLTGVITRAPKGQFPKALLLPHIQAQFTEVLRAGFAQVPPEAIDWLEVVANWHLPFDPKTIKPRKR
jgi:hypothetical protein